MNIKETAKKIHENAVDKGFWDDMEWYSDSVFETIRDNSSTISVYRKIKDMWIVQELALIGTEVSEAIEAMRKGDIENFAEELADIVIRTFDLAEGLGIDIEQEIKTKMEYNVGREYKHGKKF